MDDIRDYSRQYPFPVRQRVSRLASSLRRKGLLVRRSGTVGTAVTGVVLAVVALTGCQSASGSAALSAAATAPVTPPSVTVNGQPAGAEPTTVPLGQPVTFAVSDGSLRQTTVHASDGMEIAGVVGDGAQSWTSRDPLWPGTQYDATLAVADRRGSVSQQVVRFDTAAPTTVLDGFILPDATTVGVGQPITVTFNRAVPDRAAIQRRLSVSMTIPVDGAWHWMSDREVHFRPRAYWPAGEHLDVALKLKGYDAGQGMWGMKDHTSSITVGDAVVSRVDAAAHTMTVTSNGQELRTIPISAGSAKYPSANGVHVVLEKQASITMDSATVGIPRDSPDGYYETVLWDVRISNGGAFVHAAPWSVGAQGNSNVSHGCVNLAPSAAQWFYGLARAGDIVEVVNSTRDPDPGDAGTAEWNMSWEDWLSGGAPTS